MTCRLLPGTKINADIVHGTAVMLRPEIIHQFDPGELILQGLRYRPDVRGDEQRPGVRRHPITRPEREL